MEDNISLSTFRKLSSTSVCRSIIPSEASSIQGSIWIQIINEYERNRSEYFQQKELSKIPDLVPNDDVEYLRTNVLPELYLALENTLLQAVEWDCLQYQKCYFNGIDNISEFLWNNNQKYPDRKQNWKTKFEIPWVIELLKEKPRPAFPLSWLWSEDCAALIIQKFYRAYKDLKGRDDIYELQDFWKALAKDKMEDEEKEADAKDILIAEKEARKLARANLMQSIELARQARYEARKIKEIAEKEFKIRKGVEMVMELTQRRERRARLELEKQKKKVETEPNTKQIPKVVQKVSSNATTCG